MSDKKARFRGEESEKAKNELPESNLKTQEPKTAFSSWFTLNLSSQAWTRDAVKLFFKGEGLTDLETNEKYDSCYKKFCGK